MKHLFFLIVITILISTIWYLYLHKKTRISLKYLYIDNVIVFVFSSIAIYFIDSVPIFKQFIFITPILLVFGLSFFLTMYRFWRTPNRKVYATQGEIVSPADGNVIYIKELAAGNTPISVKNGLEAKLSEIAETDLLDQDGWLVGINMTPFDVHKNCAPVSGSIILNKHINGEFLSLKHPSALVRNERNSLVIKTYEGEYFGIIQTASKLVKRIDSYVNENDNIKQGDWFGMIRFGSQVDVIIPKSYRIKVELGQQIYAKTTIIAEK